MKASINDEKKIKIKANGTVARDNKDPIDLEAARLLLLKQKDNSA